MTDFFLRRPVLQSTPFKEDKDRARVLKTTAEIEQAWYVICERRRRGEPDDSREIQSPDRLKDMWNAWMQDWLDAEATRDKKERSAPNRRVFSPRGCTAMWAASTLSWPFGRPASRGLHR